MPDFGYGASLQLLILWPVVGWAGCMGLCDWSGSETNAQDSKVLACARSLHLFCFLRFYLFK